ncbi:MAG: hypothetical protein AAF959_17240 [Cyanobacteria bacterium P01_D01_bin.56]
MAAIALKTELDVAELLLARGWVPQEINSILVFPLPRAAFCNLLPVNCTFSKGPVTKVTAVTPNALRDARRLLLAAGWLEQELNSLLKPCLHSIDPWLNQTLHRSTTPRQKQPPSSTLNLRYWLGTSTQTLSLQQHRYTMAMKRMGSLGFLITGVCLVVILAG